MPTCPHCKKVFTFNEIGIDNILEGNENEIKITPEKIEPKEKIKAGNHARDQQRRQGCH